MKAALHTIDVMQLRGPVLAALVMVCGTAHAQPKQNLPALVGANQVMKITTPVGFVDDVVAYDNQRLAYVVAETGTKAELHVVQLGCTTCIEEKQEIVVDLAPVTLRPTALRLVGTRAFVIGTTEDGSQVAALVDLGKRAPTYKLGPATHITLVTRDGKPRVAVHRESPTKTGTRHLVELFALETGKRITKGRPFDLAGDHHKKLDFRVNHWSDGWTRAGGIKGGDWVKKENQRSPDTEATYDLLSGKFVVNKAITDLIEQRKRYQTLAEVGTKVDFVRMAHDHSAIEIWRDGAPSVATLDQPLRQYDPKSLQGVLLPDGSAWLALKVDPVNPDAVARKKADPEYLDVFRVGSDGKAVRKARILAKGVRHRFGIPGLEVPGTAPAAEVDGYFWLLERSAGFDRGGRTLTVYRLQ